MVLKKYYNAEIHNTVGDICAEIDFEGEFNDVAKLCLEFGPDGSDISLDDGIYCGKDESYFEEAEEESDLGDMYSFTMRDILEADNVQTKYDEIEARCLAEANEERKLVVDYGWCSTNAGFVIGLSDDSSNYCSPSQTSCDSYIGCNTDLSSCCIVHDKCLQAPFDGRSYSLSNSICGATDCKGGTCDSNLSKCAYKVSNQRKKWGWSSRSIFWYDFGQWGAAKAVGFSMSFEPNKSFNSNGQNTNQFC
jgi:hypothetical protein